MRARVRLMNNEDIISSEKCTGCTACVAVCAAGAIRMEADEEGFPIPRIDAGKCTDCGLCRKVCQIYGPGSAVGEPVNSAYAVYYDNDAIRKGSASGAYFQNVAEHFVRNGGYVCGCVLEDMKVRHTVTDKLDDVRRMADSKYVQSDMNDCFRRIRELLDKGVPVLFSGTSCQNAGLRSYLGVTHTDTDKLLCIDFFCHGVPSPMIWDEYVRYYERKKKRKAVGYRWRCKDYGWGRAARGRGYLSTLFYKSGADVRRDRSITVRSWRQIFFSDLVLRRCCHSCGYCTVNKPSDITMGDFWKIDDVLPGFDDGKGTSLVIVHDRSKEKYITEPEGLVYKKVDVNEAVKGQLNAFRPSCANEKRDEFWSEYRSEGFEYVVRRYFIPLKRYIKEPVRKVLFLLKLRNY